MCEQIGQRLRNALGHVFCGTVCFGGARADCAKEPEFYACEIDTSTAESVCAGKRHNLLALRAGFEYSGFEYSVSFTVYIFRDYAEFNYIFRAL